jgi:drug/metabolite transporter (DMT)-like permease
MFASYTYAILASLFWGAGFIGSRFGLEALSPMWVTFFRFLIAFICLLPLFRGCKRADFNFETIKGSLICGIMLTFMIFFQVKGLQYTTVAKSSFITITYAFITPLICFAVFKERLSALFWSTTVMAMVGILLLCNLDISNLNYGDFLTFIGALISSIHLIVVSKYAKKVPRLAVFNIFQMLTVCIISFSMAMIFEGVEVLKTGTIIQDHKALGGIVFMGIFSTAIAFMYQVKAQKVLKPYVAGVIFLMESPIAAVMGYFIFKETLTQMAIAGCILVMFSVVILPFEQILLTFIRNSSSKLAPAFKKLSPI